MQHRAIHMRSRRIWNVVGVVLPIAAAALVGPTLCRAESDFRYAIPPRQMSDPPEVFWFGFASSNISSTCINAQGEVVAPGSVYVNNANRSAFARFGPGVRELVAVRGDALSDGTAVGDFYNSMCSLADSGAMFLGNRPLLVRMPGHEQHRLEPIFVIGDPTPELPGFTIATYNYYSAVINDAGEVALRVELRNEASGALVGTALYRRAPSGETVLLATQVAANPVGSRWPSWPLIGSDGSVYWHQSGTAGGNHIMRNRDGVTAPVILPEAASEVFGPGVRFSDFGYNNWNPTFSLNHHGDMSFFATIEGPGVTPSNNEVLCLRSAGVISVVAREGDATPWDASVRFGPFVDTFGQLDTPQNTAALAGNGSMLFWANLIVPGEILRRGAVVRRDAGGQPHLVARVGDPLVGDPSIKMPRTFSWSMSLSANDSGQLELVVSGTDHDDFLLGIDHQGRSHVLAAANRFYTVDGYRFRLRNLFPHSNRHRTLGDDGGHETGLTDAGDVLFDMNSMLVVAKIPFDYDPIDFNNDGVYPDGRDLEDFFGVIAGGDCSTGNCNDLDFNNDGTVADDADTEAFLRAFAGEAC